MTFTSFSINAKRISSRQHRIRYWGRLIYPKSRRIVAAKTKENRIFSRKKNTFKLQNKNEISSNRHKTIPKFRNGNKKKYSDECRPKIWINRMTIFHSILLWTMKLTVYAKSSRKQPKYKSIKQWWRPDGINIMAFCLFCSFRFVFGVKAKSLLFHVKFPFLSWSVMSAAYSYL